MRTFSFDQFEFEDASTEERLQISLANQSEFPCPNVNEFVATCIGVEAASKLGAPVLFADHFGYGKVRKYLSHFADIELPDHCKWPCYLLSDGPGEWSLVFEAPTRFIHYCWSTSA